MGRPPTGWTGRAHTIANEAKAMSHWHECMICNEYFECYCEAPRGLLVCCRDCAHKLRLHESLLADTTLEHLFRLPVSCN